MSTENPTSKAPASGLPASFQFKPYEEASARTTAAAKLGQLSGDAPVPIKTGGWNDTRNDINSDGKYLLLAVPDWQPGMSSYLRLGASCSTWSTALGSELEKIIHLVGATGMTTSLPFIDDERKRGGAAVHPGVGATVSESEILHTKGGWRDHTDGNRITTTYGDKIEIIRGNYKMITLGRQDTPEESAGWDASGQHIQDWSYSTPGACVTVEWVADYGGIWLQKSSNEMSDSWTRHAGDKKEEYWGDLRESYIGQEAPGESLPQEPRWLGGAPDPSLKTNPVIIEKTFALSITSQTGSQVLPVPTISESTYVTASVSTTFADSITDTKTVTGAIIETTTAGSTADTTSVLGDVGETTTVGGSVVEMTTVSGGVTGATTVAGTITEITNALTITDMTTTTAMSSTTTTGVATDITLAATRTDVFVGALDVDLCVAGCKVDAAIAIRAQANLAAITTFTLFEMELNTALKDEDKASKLLLAGICVIASVDINMTADLVGVRGLLVMVGL